MSEYRFLCPRCGRAFEENSLLTVCPNCQELLRSTVGFAGKPSSAGLANLPSHLDLASLMRRALAEEPQKEAVDAALRRVLQKEVPQAQDGLFGALSAMLSAQQRLWGISRLEAARRVAQGRSEMHLSPQGIPEITSFYSQFRAEGLEHLPPEQREQVYHRLEEAARTGRPIPEPIVLTPQTGMKGRAVVWLAILTALGFAAFYCISRVLAAR